MFSGRWMFSFIIFLSPVFAFATTYTPGQTLDPSCTPSDPTCLVVGPATNVAGIFTATSTTQASTFPYASSTALTVVNFFGTNAQIFGSSTIGNGTQVGGLTISGGATTTGQSLFTSANFPVIKVQRTFTTGLGVLNTVATFDKYSSSGGMADGFGPGIGLTISTVGSENNLIARVGAVRDGADNSGKLSFATYNAGVSSENMVITSAGNVGIGTTTPWGKLSVSAAANASSPQFVVASTTAVSFMVDKSGNVGVGTTTPDAKVAISGDAQGAVNSNLLFHVGDTAARALTGSVAQIINNSQSPGGLEVRTTQANSFNDARILVVANDGSYLGMGQASSIYAGSNIFGSPRASTSFIFNSSGNEGGAVRDLAIGTVNAKDLILGTNNAESMRIKSGGFVGIGTSTPTAQLSTTGTVRFSNFGAGTLTTDASGNLSVSSDERLKNIDGQFTRGLSDIMKLSPISYHWNQLSGLDTTTSYSGFSAQNVQTAIPEAVGSSTNGFLTLQDRPILAATVNAIKDIGSVTGIFKDGLVTFLIGWLGDSNNHLSTIHTDRLCVGNTCLNESQIQ
ncbi:MAG: hypothetical protein JWO50_51, partial [Candidatus Kaiserbacteria bacterium]|nr:hypothetical protein [Candidatus Kaiserbacteria bacterium]